MTTPTFFHRALATRILRAIGVASIVPVAIACTSSANRTKAGASSSGAGGASSSSRATTSSVTSSVSSSSGGSSSSTSTGAGGAIACSGTQDCPCWDCVCAAASNYEIARDCIDGLCASGTVACTALCADLNSTLGTVDAGPCFTIDAGQPPVTVCMPVPDGGVCSTNFGVVLQQFLALNCPTGFEPYEILSGPMTAPAGECCYTAHDLVCTAGGRPYVVEGEARIAPVSPGDGWSAPGAPGVEGLSIQERGELARAWTAEAAGEHASVASFARFALALMGVGAPSRLVQAAHEAAIDEVRHARVCFGLASAYAGDEIAPGAFPASTPGPDGGSIGLADVAAAVASEGCVDETIFAVLAAERARLANDPYVRSVLAFIADDEARHAELAWSTVAWAISEGGEPVRAAVEEAIDRALRRARARMLASGAATSTMALERHGVVSAKDARRAFDLAITTVVIPARRALRAAAGLVVTA